MSEELIEYPRRRGIYLLPNLFTMGALFAGFYAIVAATKHYYDNAAIAILVAILLDGVDGRLARLTHTVSDFGAHFDSLSDMLCFGLSPALVLYSWSLSSLGKAGWLASFIYTAATALRLARFNTQLGRADKRYFQGLSTTLSAGLVASILWVSVKYHINGYDIAWEMALVAIILAILKVSVIRYRSFKDLGLRGKVPFVVIPVVALGFVLISYSPPEAFLAIFLLYALSGPVDTLFRKRRSKKTSPTGVEQHESSEH